MFGKLVTLPTKTFGKFHVVCTGVVDKGEGEGVFLFLRTKSCGGVDPIFMLL